MLYASRFTFHIMTSTKITSSALQHPIVRVFADRREQLDDWVIAEEPLAIEVNGQEIAVLMRMPGMEKELAAGFLVTENYLRSASDILIIHHCGRGLPAPGEDAPPDPAQQTDTRASRHRVQVRVTPDAFRPPNRVDAVRLIRSGCGAAGAEMVNAELPRVTSALRVTQDVLLSLNRALRDSLELHQYAGGTHGAGIFTAQGELVISAEDIGRHNAVDKVIGHCLLLRIDLSDKIIVTTGRASYEMVMKAARVGIPISATLSAPTYLAVQAAEASGVTLLAYLRGNRFNAYTHTRRIVT